MGIPAVVGTQDATSKLKEGEIITVNGFTGNIFKGKVSENVQKEIKPVTQKTKTEIKVIVDLPSFAERAAKTNLKKVGLARLEGVIAESGKHPEFFLQNKNLQEYEEIIFKGMETLSKPFKEIWVRTSDIRSDEFANLEGAPKEKEANPMLGMHGIRYGLKNPELLKSELRALKRVSEQGKKIGIMIPQVISVEELKQTKKLLHEIKFTGAKVGIMVETPAAVQLIREFCEEGLDFISFGTNDLTQYILAVDRGNKKVQELFNEMHPAVLHQLEYVLRVCSRNNVETSICGQAGSKKEMVKFLVERGIDSISVNADVAAEIAEYVAKLESQSQEETSPEGVGGQEVMESEEEKTLPPSITEKEDVEVETQDIEKKESVNNENNNDNNSPKEIVAEDSSLHSKTINNNPSNGSGGRDTNDKEVKTEENKDETLVEEDPAKKPVEEKEEDDSNENTNNKDSPDEEKTLEEEEDKDSEPSEKTRESGGGINLENEHAPSETSEAPSIPGSEFAIKENLKEEVLDIF